MKILQRILLVLLFVVVFLAGVNINRNTLIRLYWEAKFAISKFAVNQPELSSYLFPNFNSMLQNEYLSINDKPLIENEDPLSFFVIGHVYGDKREDVFHPATTLVTNVQKINDTKPDLIIMLGDLTIKPIYTEYVNLENYLLEPLTMPVYNVVGNHDVLISRKAYEERYGKTIYSFVYKEYLFLFLDTSIESCSLSNDQYEYISEQIELARNEYDLQGINIFLHHVLFWDKTKSGEENSYAPNSDCMNSTEFFKFANKTLSGISEETPIYIFAGDVGAIDSQLSPFYDKLEDYDIYMFATGLGNSSEDSILNVHEKKGELSIEAFALDGREMMPIESYDYTYWLK